METVGGIFLFICGLAILCYVLSDFDAAVYEGNTTRWFDRGEGCLMSECGKYVISLRPGERGTNYVLSHNDGFGNRYMQRELYEAKTGGKVETTFFDQAVLPPENVHSVEV